MSEYMNRLSSVDNNPIDKNAPGSTGKGVIGTTAHLNLSIVCPYMNMCDKGSDELSRLKPGDYRPLQKLSPHHWAAILSLYNTTFLSGGYITILPPIQLASAVSPEQAIAQRNELEKLSKIPWEPLAVAMDPFDIDEEFVPSLPTPTQMSDAPFFPSSPMELFLTAILCIISVLVLTYTFVVLYRCICSRNYAEWRASWMGTKEASDPSSQVVLEAVPLVLSGHAQPVECLASDGHWLVSSCLAGNIRVWDSTTGDLVTITRAKPQNPLTTGDEDALYKELDNVCSQIKSPNSRTLHNTATQFKPDADSAIDPCFCVNDVHNSWLGRCRESSSNYVLPQNATVSETEAQSSDTNSDQHKQSSVMRETGGGECKDYSQSTDDGPRISPIWCLDCQNNLIVVGCASGHIEIWEATSGKCKSANFDLAVVAIWSSIWTAVRPTQSSKVDVVEVKNQIATESVLLDFPFN
ncbi:hypothetical protein J6590_000393 [Homalodisca vitripennis]|nr:hypothetical protein J6590_000393 [Homalodisca vitripennis]